MLPYVSNPAYLSQRRTLVRFENIFLLHGKGGSPEGSVRQLKEELRRYYPASTSGELFQRPRLLLQP